MKPITIRKATISDLETIQEISTKTFIKTFAELNTAENMRNYIQDNFSLKQVTSEINNTESAFYLVILDNETIAYLKLNFGNTQSDSRSSQSMEIHRIYVLKKFHGKKIGQILLNKAIRIGQQSGIDNIWLGVWEKNYKAIQFYIKNDFVEFDKHSFTLGNDKQTDY